MGLRDFLRRKTPLERAAGDLMEGYAQADVRRQAMTTLLDLATPESLAAVLKRFTYNAHVHTVDDSEKRDLVELLGGAGDEVIDPLKAFIRSEKAVVFPIRALLKKVSKEECVSFLVETLTGLEPLDHRTTDQKRALIQAIGDLGGAADAECLTPYLQDHSDDVQITVVEALQRLENPSTRDGLARVCCRDTHAARVQVRAAQVLMDNQWSVKPHWDAFMPEVKSEFMLTKKGLLKRKTARADAD